MRNTYTPDEAKQKWCPFARCVDIEKPVAGNRVTLIGTVLIPESAKCIGPSCMAWIWETNERGSCGLRN